MDYELYWKHNIKSADCIRVSNDSGHILTSSSNGHVYFIDSSGNLIWKNQITNIRTISISEDAKYVAVGSMEELFVFSTDGKLVWKKNVGKINAIAISTTANSIAVGTDLGTLFNFSLSGDELWKKKVKGVFRGGIFYTEESDSIVLGSWNKILCFSSGEILWEHKTKTRIENADVFNNLIAICTRRGLEVIDNKGNLIFISKYPYKKIAIRDADHIYALTNSKIDILDSIGETIQTLEFEDDLIDFAVNRNNGDVAAVSKGCAFSYSTTLKPHFRICTKSVLFGKTKPIEFEIENICGKKIDCEIEVTSDAFQIPNKHLAMELAPHKTKTCSIMATPEIPGDNEIIFKIVNKKLTFSDNIHVDIEKIDLETILYPKYKFNVADDPITCLVDIKNNSGLAAKNISIKGNPDLFFEELLPGSKHTFNFKIDLNEGTHNISKIITYKDDFGNQYESFCEKSIQVDNAPYVWEFLDVDNLINGKKSLVTLSFKNISNKTIDMDIEIYSKSICFSPDKFNLSVEPSGDKTIDIEMIPNDFGESTIDLAVMENNHNRKHHAYFNVSLGPPSITIKSRLLKNKYVAGDSITQQLKLTNEGDEPALNIEIEGQQKFLSIQPNESLTCEFTSKIDETKKLRPVIARYKNGAGELFEARCENILDFDVIDKRLEISTLNLQVIENRNENYAVILENISNRSIENIEYEVRADPDEIRVTNEKIKIALIEPMSKKRIEFPIEACLAGTFDFNFIARFDGIEMKSTGNIIAEPKIPEFEMTIVNSNLVAKEFDPLKINLRNISETAIAKNISVEIKIPLIKYNDIIKINEIKPEQSENLEFDFKADNAGRLHFTLIVSFKSVEGISHNQEFGGVILIRRNEDNNERERGGKTTINIKKLVNGPDLSDAVGVRLNHTENQSIPVENPQPQHPQPVLTQTDMPEPERVKMYRNSCVIAFDDKAISYDERIFLDFEAKILKLSTDEKEMVENDIFGEFLNKTNMIEAYRKLYYNSLMNGGKISSDERNMLNTIRENLNLSAEEQKIIEEEEVHKQVDNDCHINHVMPSEVNVCTPLLEEAPPTTERLDNNIDERLCLACGAVLADGAKFCGQCRRKVKVNKIIGER